MTDLHPLSPGGNTLVLLDACILLPLRLSDVLFVSDNTRHLAVADARKLGIDVIKAGSFLDRLFEADPQRTSHAIAKALNDLKKPPYSM